MTGAKEEQIAATNYNSVDELEDMSSESAAIPIVEKTMATCKEIRGQSSFYSTSFILPDF